MGTHYEQIKKETKIVEALDASDSDSENEKVFREMKPKAKINFKDYIKK